MRRVGFEADHESGQGTDPLTAHRVALVGHRRGADLLLLERLLDFLAMGQQPEIGGRLVSTLRNARQDRRYLGIDLPRVGLAGDGVALVEADLAADQLFQSPDFGMVALEQVQETRLGAGCPLGPSGLQARQAVLELPEVQHQVVRPQTRPLADRRQLRRLQVGEAEAGQVAIPPGELGQPIDHRHQPGADQLKRLSEQQQVGIVRHETTGGPQMDDAAGIGTDVAVGTDVGHDVVADPPLVLPGHFKIDVVDVLLQLRDLLRRDGQSQLRFRLGQRHPEPPPGAELPLRAPNLTHLARSVTGDKRVFVLF